MSGLKMWLPFSSSQQLGEELVVNGDFATDSDWTKEAGWTISGGKANFSGGSGNRNMSQAIGITNGKTYEIKYTVSSISAGAVSVRLGGMSGISEVTATTTGVFSGFITANSSANGNIQIEDNDNNFVGSIDNVSVKEVTDWTLAGNVSIGNSKANFTSGTDSYVFQTILTATKSYQISADYNVTSISSGYFGTNGSSANSNNVSLAGLSGVGTISATIIAGQTSLIFRSSNFNGSVTNISAKEVTPADNGAITNGASWLPAQSTIPQLGMMDWSKGSNLMTYSEDFSEWTTSSSNTLVSGFISPLGDASAYKISGTSTTVLSTSVDTTGRTRSVYARTVSGTGTANLMTFNGNADVFNLTETWQRFEVTGWSATGASSFYLTDFRGTGSLSEFLVWGAQEVVGTSEGNYRKTNGTAVTNAILPPYPVNPTTDILGNTLRQRLNSLNLTGTGVAEVTDSASINPSAITVQFWIFSNTENAKGLVAKWGNGLLDYMLFKTTNNFRFYIGSSFKTSGTIPNTGWVNIAGTYDGSNITTFINGALSTTSSTSISIPNNTNVLEIGRYGSNSTHSYSERIDDVKLYDRALTADEILQNYKAGLSAHTN